MSDSGWDDECSSNQRGRGRGGNRGRGSYNNRNNDDFDSASHGDSWGNGGGGSDEWATNDDGEREGGSRGRGGRGGRGRGGRGGGRNMDRNNGDEDGGDGNFGLDDGEAPPNDKPRPTYIPPEIDENDVYGIGVGSNFKKYENIEVKVSGDNVPKHIESFKSSGLREVLIEKLIKCNYTTPTPIQKYCIPVIISGRDMMATAQTGSGKTVSNVKNLLSACLMIYNKYQINKW